LPMGGVGKEFFPITNSVRKKKGPKGGTLLGAKKLKRLGRGLLVQREKKKAFNKTSVPGPLRDGTQKKNGLFRSG